jgi:thermitase
MNKPKNIFGLVLLITYFLLAKIGGFTFTEKSETDDNKTNPPDKEPSKQRDRRQIFSKRYKLPPHAGRPTWSMQDIQRPEGTENLNHVIVAVVDTGVDLNHPSLKHSLWTNPGETGRDKDGNDKASNGIDDDRNGHIDDVHGWNFADGNNDVTDHHGHGTHISGIIAAKASSKNNFKGVSPNAKIMVLKYYGNSQSGKSQVKATIEAFRYATRMGAGIINYSAGGNTPNPVEQAVIEQAAKQGVVLIAAAGNLSVNTDESPYFPASYDSDNIISVAGHTPLQSLIEASNYGLQTVDLSAPGENVFSTLPGSGFGNMSGTSQATAFVTGTAALLMGQQDPPHSAQQLKIRLANSGTLNSQLKGKIANGRKLSAKRALYMRGNFSNQALSQVNKLELLKLKQKVNSQPASNLDWAQVMQNKDLNRAPSMERPKQ